MAKSLSISALMVLSVRAAGVERPPPAEGWERVGCAQVDRPKEFTFRNPPLSYEDCWTRCGRYSNFSALGDNYCWCGLESLTVTPASEDKCEAFCLANKPDTGGCGSTINGKKYFDVYKKSNPGISVIRRLSGTPTSLPGVDATPMAPCSNCTSVIPAGGSDTPPKRPTPSPCVGGNCTVTITSSGSIPFAVSTGIALSVVAMVFSLL